MVTADRIHSRDFLPASVSSKRRDEKCRLSHSHLIMRWGGGVSLLGDRTLPTHPFHVPVFASFEVVRSLVNRSAFIVVVVIVIVIVIYRPGLGAMPLRSFLRGILRPIRTSGS